MDSAVFASVSGTEDRPGRWPLREDVFARAGEVPPVEAEAESHELEGFESELEDFGPQAEAEELEGEEAFDEEEFGEHLRKGDEGPKDKESAMTFEARSLEDELPSEARIGETEQSGVAAPMARLSGSAAQMKLLRLEHEFEEHEDPSVVTPLTYDEILNRIRQELVLQFSDPNDPGLAQRRRRLRGVFASVPASRTRELYALLGEQATRDELSRLFHGRLASATRQELLRILHDRFPTAAPASAPQPQPPAPTPVWPSEPLPPAAKARFQVAFNALQQQVAGSNDPRAWRYRCWLAKLAAGADDRMIEWHKICPSTSGAIGAAYVVGPCDLVAGRSVDQAALQSAIKAVPDVEPANQRLKFITHMRSDILFAYEMTSPSLHLENFTRFHDEVDRAVTKLDLWANSALGGSSAMPPAYVSIKDWIGARQRDPNSVYSCL
jgi:hypothetical protein